MYEKHFGLAFSPFTLGPDPRFPYVTDAVQESLAVLSYGVTARKGFVQLTGDVGTGKTTILNIFLEWLGRIEASTAFISNPHLSPDEILDLMWADFGIKNDSLLKSQRMLVFNRWLLERYDSDRLVVLFIDEAQQLPPGVLEELRLLTNLETPCHKLLQIVLSGQPELELQLEKPSLRQLRQRITLRCRTEAFTEPQTAGYIRHRLKVAQAPDPDVFLPESCSAVHRYSRGIPRLINVLCEQCLIDSFCQGAMKVDARIVRRAAADTGMRTDEELSAQRTLAQRQVHDEGDALTGTTMRASAGAL